MSLDESSSQRWLAYELHDGLLQWVIGARMQLVAVVSRPDASLEQYRHATRKAIRNLETALSEARQLIGFLEQQPQPGQPRLTSALMQFVDVAKREAELNHQTLVAHIEPGTQHELVQKLAESDSWNLLRIAQQAVHNAITHAGPTQITVELVYNCEPSELRLSVVDQGRGFEYHGPKTENQHFGLNSMLHRAQLLGASLEINSAPGSGCSVLCTIPVIET